MRTLKPIEDWVWIAPKGYEEQVTEGGIIKPDVSADGSHVPYYEAEVIAIGPDVKSIKIGDIAVLHRECDSHLIDVDGKDYLVVREKNNIVATFEGERPKRELTPKLISPTGQQVAAIDRKRLQ